MFGIGSTELLLILVVALIVLGPKSLAGFARTLGKFMGEFRRVSTEFQRTLNVEAAQAEAREAAARKEGQSKKEAADSVAMAETAQERESATIPPDSPVAAALARAQAEAEEARKAVWQAEADLRRQTEAKSGAAGDKPLGN